MKIGHLDHTTAATPAATERQTGAGQGQGAARAGQGPEDSAQVALSSKAAALGSPGGEFDSEKVQRIAQAIRDGKFTVNPEAIADKLIANAQEVLNRASH